MARVYLNDKQTQPAQPQAVKPAQKKVYLKDRASQQAKGRVYLNSKPDITQSPNYINSQADAQKYAQEAQKANSGWGMLKNSLKAVPKATADVMVGTPAKFIASTAEIPEVIFKGGRTSQREYKIPGLSPFKSFQSDFQNTANDVIEGNKGLGSAAWGLAQVPLAGLEMAGIGSGINKGIKAFRGASGVSQGIRKATPEILDAFIPMKKGYKGQIPETPQLKGGSIPKIESRVDIPYNKGLAQQTENVNPLIQEAKKKAQEIELLKKAGKIKPDDKNYWSTPIEGQPKAPMPDIKDVNGIVPKEGDKIEFDGILGGKGTGTVRWSEPTIANASGKIQEGNWIGNGILNDRQTFKIIERDGKPLKSQPLQEGGKQRGFIESVKNSPELSQDLANRVEGDYDAISNKPMQEKAQRLIFDNVNEAERVARENIGAEGVITGNELVKHYDSIAINAKKTGDIETFNQALDKASDLVKTQAKNLTEAGQTVQAASTINKLSPEGVLHYVNKIAREAGTDLKLSNEKTFEFMRQAEEIQNILDPRERAFKTFDLIDNISENVPRGGKDKLLEALNLPRAIMATADLSAPLRQGIFSAARNPKTFLKNFGSMFKYAFSEKAYRNLKADIVTSPNYSLYQKYKLPLTDVSAGLTGREEQFMSTLADKIPIFGTLSKGSNRAYTGFLNKMRVDLFDDFVKTAKLEGITDPKFFEDAATFVGSATGRGKLGRFEDAAKLLNTTFFSPRLMASRVNLINPVYYAKLNPTVRKEALKTLASFIGTGTGVLAMAKLNGADVSADPRSADFGKIKIGKTRYDIWGGFQQYARVIGQ